MVFYRVVFKLDLKSKLVQLCNAPIKLVTMVFEDSNWDIMNDFKRLYRVKALNCKLHGTFCLKLL